MTWIKNHPEYDALVNDWIYFRDHYRGGPPYIRADYLKKYQIEPQKFFTDRKERAAYKNYCAPVVDMYVSHVVRDISRQIKPEEPKEAVEKIAGATKEEKKEELMEIKDLFPVEDVDNMGTHINDYMRKSATMSAYYGHVYLFVDVTKTEIEPLSEADREVMEVRPYVTTIVPERMVNWSLDRWGKPIFVVWEEDVPDIQDFKAERKEDYKEKPNYRVWYRDRWELYDNEELFCGEPFTYPKVGFSICGASKPIEWALP